VVLLSASGVATPTNEGTRACVHFGFFFYTRHTEKKVKLLLAAEGFAGFKLN